MLVFLSLATEWQPDLIFPSSLLPLLVCISLCVPVAFVFLCGCMRTTTICSQWAGISHRPDPNSGIWGTTLSSSPFRTLPLCSLLILTNSISFICVFLSSFFFFPQLSDYFSLPLFWFSSIPATGLILLWQLSFHQGVSAAQRRRLHQSHSAWFSSLQ